MPSKGLWLPSIKEISYSPEFKIDYKSPFIASCFNTGTRSTTINFLMYKTESSVHIIYVNNHSIGKQGCKIKGQMSLL